MGILEGEAKGQKQRLQSGVHLPLQELLQLPHQLQHSENNIKLINSTATIITTITG